MGRKGSRPSVPGVKGSRAERFARGKDLRGRIPRSSQGHWDPKEAVPDVVDFLKRGDQDRLRKLLPIRYGRMAISPFGFLRGSAGVMAHDLSKTPVTGLQAQLCGDAHLNNFGIFATPERAEVFDVNDFDETLPGPWEWDVKRLAVSVVLAGRAKGFSEEAVRKATLRGVRAYRERMNALAKLPYLDIWYSHLDLSSAERDIRRLGRKEMAAEVEEARHRTGFHAFPRLTRAVHGTYLILDDSPLITHDAAGLSLDEVREIFARYLTTVPDDRRELLDRYELVDAARKVVGIGSVGTVCAIMVLTADPDVQDPLILQIKEAQTSALEPYVAPSRYPNHAQRVVAGQHLMQEASDLFLGWSAYDGRDYYIRQLRDMKYSADISTMGPKALMGQSELCGAALARGHARSGDPAMISGYLGDGKAFETAVLVFAKAYAAQTERYYHQFLKAIQSRDLPSVEPD